MCIQGVLLCQTSKCTTVSNLFQLKGSGSDDFEDEIKPVVESLWFLWRWGQREGCGSHSPSKFYDVRTKDVIQSRVGRLLYNQKSGDKARSDDYCGNLHLSRATQHQNCGSSPSLSVVGQ